MGNSESSSLETFKSVCDLCPETVQSDGPGTTVTGDCHSLMRLWSIDNTIFKKCEIWSRPLEVSTVAKQFVGVGAAIVGQGDTSPPPSKDSRYEGGAETVLYNSQEATIAEARELQDHGIVRHDMVVLIGDEITVFMEFHKNGVSHKSLKTREYIALNLIDGFKDNDTKLRQEKVGHVTAGEIYAILQEKSRKTYSLPFWNCQHFAKCIFDAF